MHERGSAKRGRYAQDALTELHERSDVIRDAFVRPGSEVKMVYLPGLGALKLEQWIYLTSMFLYDLIWCQ